MMGMSQPPALVPALAVAGGTDIGCRRDMNQDAWAWGSTLVGAPEPIGPQQADSLALAGEVLTPGWVAVADGMGGARGGEVASRRALQAIGAALAPGGVASGETSVDRMAQALRSAHLDLAAYEQERAVWQAERERIAADRVKRGLPPIVREGGNRGAPSRPGPTRPSRPTRYYEIDELQRFVRRKARLLYESGGGELPSLNVVGYSPNARGQAVIELLAATFPGGTSRVMTSFDPTTDR